MSNNKKKEFVKKAATQEAVNQEVIVEIKPIKNNNGLIQYSKGTSALFVLAKFKEFIAEKETKTAAQNDLAKKILDSRYDRAEITQFIQKSVISVFREEKRKDYSPEERAIRGSSSYIARTPRVLADIAYKLRAGLSVFAS